MLEERAATQHCVNRLDNMAARNPMKPNKGKCRDLHVGQDNSMPQYRLGLTGWKAALQKRFWW